MGDLDVAAGDDEARRRQFARALLDDLEALAQMVRDGTVERGVRRIGFEQELFLVRPSGRPAPIAMELLARLADPSCTTEIGRFNLEHNAPPSPLAAGCLSGLEAHLDAALDRVRNAARAVGADLALAGILPSIQLADLVLDNLTPLPRYRELNRVITSLCGGEVRTLIQGRDNLQVNLGTVMLETCNTSIQVHLQVDAEQLPTIYNIAQLVSGPVVAAAANSPLLLQHRLWHETRIPAFEQSVDIRSTPDRQRDTWQRVHFGDDWVGGDILDVYHDQVARHRITLMGETGESSLAVLARGEVPALRALSLHNGSLYRWNRLCYGVTDGRPHLRIEHRPVAAGPTVLDEVANTALFLGLVLGLEAEVGDVRRRFTFSDAKANFVAGARYGLEATMRWDGGRALPVRDLLGAELLPLARRGLLGAGLDPAEVDRFLGVIEARVASGRNGARWMLDAYEALGGIPNRIARAEAVTRAMMARQWRGEPVHEWTVPTADEGADWTSHCSTVGQLMTTDVFTVRPGDLVDMAASVMEWKHIRHVPVEDDTGALVGLVSHRQLLQHWAQHGREPSATAVRDVMTPAVITVAPLDGCRRALALMREHEIGCLPVVHEGRLVGIVSERDFLPLAERGMGAEA
jgi:CBS domain-containing protein